MRFYFNYTDDKRTTPEGKRQFTLDWMNGERRRGQYFFAIPAEHIAQLRENGHEVVEGVVAPWREKLGKTAP